MSQIIDWKLFKILIIIFSLEFLILFLFFSNMNSYYDKNLFEVSINDKMMKCYYKEKKKYMLFTIAGTASYNNVENQTNRVELKDPMLLNIDEYEVYYKNGNRKGNMTGWNKSGNLIYNSVENDIEIEIKRMNKILYKGDYIKDVTKYINEKGRYYVHIYVVRKENIFSHVDTHIAFNVIVGENNEI